MKALLINGARPLTSLYDFQVNTATNSQGWGLINLPNSLPAALLNLLRPSQPDAVLRPEPGRTPWPPARAAPALSPWPSDAQPAVALHAGLDRPAGQSRLPSLKLVNDLDLVVTNLDTGEVFFGNDIAAGSHFNLPWDTNTAAQLGCGEQRRERLSRPAARAPIIPSPWWAAGST